MKDKKQIITEITNKQNENISEFAKTNGLNRSEAIRILCNILEGLDFKNTTIILHDDMNVKVISSANNPKTGAPELMVYDTFKDDDITGVQCHVVYEPFKDIESYCTVTKKQYIRRV